MIKDAARSREESPATPILGIVSPPSSYRNEVNGKDVAEDEVDLVSRLMFMQQSHKTYAGTSTVCTGVAARLPGTLVHEASRLQTRRRRHRAHRSSRRRDRDGNEDSKIARRVDRATGYARAHGAPHHGRLRLRARGRADAAGSF